MPLMTTSPDLPTPRVEHDDDHGNYARKGR